MDLIHKKKENRAQIFQSFDSLKGFKEMIQECEVEIVSPRILSQDDYEILDERVHQIQKGMMVTIEYYDRIHYKRITGVVSKINLDTQILQIVKTKINLKQISYIQIRGVKTPLICVVATNQCISFFSGRKI